MFYKILDLDQVVNDHEDDFQNLTKGSIRQMSSADLRDMLLSNDTEFSEGPISKKEYSKNNISNYHNNVECREFNFSKDFYDKNMDIE
jgi:hypothetical protein